MRTSRLLVALAPLLGCLDQRPGITDPDAIRFAVIVSRPLAAAALASPHAGAPAQTETAADSVVYVSLVPGTVPGGATIAITNLTTGSAETASLLNGGLDPIAIPARTGDTLRLAATDSAGRTRVEAAAAGPVHPLVVVRTDPPTGGTDVTLNAQIVVVFSEPMDPGTITAQTVQVLLRGVTVSGSVTLSTDGLVATFYPDVPFSAASVYTLVVSSAVSTLAGAHLNTSVVVTFQTGSTANNAVNIPSAPMVSAGMQHTCAVTATGDAYCWGHNLAGELGIGVVSDYISTPQRVSGGLQFAIVGAGGGFTCGLTRMGAAYCWGGDSSGVLGIGSPDTLSRAVPTRVYGGLAFTSLSVGPDHVCGTTSDGRAVCWGNGSTGQLGEGATFQMNEASHTPLMVDTSSAFEKNHPAAVSATGLLHTCGVDSSGYAYCWGTLSYQVMALGKNVEILDWTGSPTLIRGTAFRSVSTGLFHSCGVTADSSGLCWGVNNGGELGTGSIATGSVVGGLKFQQIVPGQGEFTCGLVVGGAAYCWGLNDHGELGSAPDTTGCPLAPPLGSIVYYAAVNPGARIPCSRTPVRAAAPLTFSYLSTGTTHTCGVSLDGQLYCWGGNDWGQLGIAWANTWIPVHVPVQLGETSLSQALRAPAGGVTRPTVSPATPRSTIGSGRVCNVACKD